MSRVYIFDFEQVFAHWVFFLLLLLNWFSKAVFQWGSRQYIWEQLLIFRCGGLWPIRDLLCTEWDLPKRKERFILLEWGNRKLSLNQLHECKSRTRWVMYFIDYGDGANYHPLPLLETAAAVAYLNLTGYCQTRMIKFDWLIV